MIVESSAPSNIALIKYMGKLDQNSNVPTNSSLSLTLDELRTFVRITLKEELTHDQWAPLKQDGLQKIELSQKSIDRFLKHFQFLKNEWGIQKCFLIESANNFPSDCGLASSASSFAALTKAAVEMFQSLSPRADIGVVEQAEYSRQGSGSSCRSFFGPFALWHKEGVRPLEFPMSALLHQVIVVESGKKEVSSSEAHRRVSRSDLFQGRPERAEKRMSDLFEAFRNQDWKNAYEICWAEFWDMHALFETCHPPFGYMEPGTLTVLHEIRKLWQEKNDGPIVTMDAGANVHLIWRQEQKAMAMEVQSKMKNRFSVYTSEKMETGN